MASREADRLAALQRYRVLDTEPEQAFDDLARLASHICHTPMALITMVDEHRQWFKARVGISVPETPRGISFCAHAIEHEGIFEVPDALADQRFRDNPTVTGDPKIRFYAGAPLVTPDGFAVGTICVLDRVPRHLTSAEADALTALKRQAEAQLALRVQVRELEAAVADRDRLRAEEAILVEELRSALDEVRHLGALVPLASACQFSVVIPADPQAIPAVMDGVLKMLRGKGWGEEEMMSVELALQEALANGIRHGCKNDATKSVECDLAFEASGELVIVVRDPGSGFDQKAVANPLDPENLLKPSGRGIFLINQLMDEVNFAQGGSEVQMRKRKI